MDAREKRALIAERVADFEVDASDIEGALAIVELAERAKAFSTEGLSDAEGLRALADFGKGILTAIDEALGEGASETIFAGLAHPHTGRLGLSVTITGLVELSDLMKSATASFEDEIADLAITVEDVTGD